MISSWWHKVIGWTLFPFEKKVFFWFSMIMSPTCFLGSKIINTNTTTLQQVFVLASLDSDLYTKKNHLDNDPIHILVLYSYIKTKLKMLLMIMLMLMSSTISSATWFNLMPLIRVRRWFVF